MGEISTAIIERNYSNQQPLKRREGMGRVKASSGEGIVLKR